MMVNRRLKIVVQLFWGSNYTCTAHTAFNHKITMPYIYCGITFAGLNFCGFRGSVAIHESFIPRKFGNGPD